MDRPNTPDQALAAMASPDLSTRAAALDLLERQRHPQAPASLVVLLKDPTMPDSLRMRAAAALRWQVSQPEPGVPAPAPSGPPTQPLELPPSAQARPTVRLTTPARRWPKVLAGVLLLVVAIGGYYARGAWLVRQADLAYRAASCSAVLQIANTLAWQYPATLAPFAGQAGVPSLPCRSFAGAAERQARHDWAGAYAAYTDLLAAYPSAPFAAQAAAQRDQAVLAWGRQLRRDEDFQAALEAYALLTRPDDAVQARRRVAEVALFTEWAEQRRAAGDFAGAVEHLTTLLEYYPDEDLAQPARQRVSQIRFEWAEALRAGKHYADAEHAYHDLVEWAGAQGQSELVATARAGQARLYLAWAAALQASSDFGPALSKLQLVAKTDPQPDLPDSLAAHARLALPALHTAWGQQLLGLHRFNEAISHLLIVLDLRGADRAQRAVASDQIASAYLAWGKNLRGDEQFQLALQRIASARQFAATQPLTDTVQQAEAATLDQFAHSSGADAQALIDQAVSQVCGGQGQGASPVLARADAPRRLRAYGEHVKIDDPAVRAGSPAELHYVACVEQQVNTIETCTYQLTNGGWAWIARESVAWVVRLRSSTTAEVLAENTLYSSQPDGCPAQDRFYNGETRQARGSAPTAEALRDWLRQFVQ